MTLFKKFAVWYKFEYYFENSPAGNCLLLVSGISRNPSLLKESRSYKFAFFPACALQTQLKLSKCETCVAYVVNTAKITAITVNIAIRAGELPFSINRKVLSLIGWEAFFLWRCLLILVIFLLVYKC